MTNVAERPPTSDIHVHPPLVHVESRWEYKIVVRDRSRDGGIGEEELNQLGSDGWELVGILSDDSMVSYYFKRSSS